MLGSGLDSAEEDGPDDELLSDDVGSEAYAFSSSDSDHKGSQCRTLPKMKSNSLQIVCK